MKKLQKRIIIGFLVLVLLPTMSISSFANEKNGRYIKSTITFIPYSGFGSTSIAHFNNALWEWNNASSKNLMNRSPTERHNASYYDTSYNAPDDGKSYIYACNTGSINYMTQRRIYPRSGDAVTSADINFNMHANYPWANSQQQGKYDVWTAFMFETGSVAGLGSPSDSSSVMHMPEKNKLRRSPSSGDRRVIRSIYYPGSKSTFMIAGQEKDEDEQSYNSNEKDAIILDGIMPVFTLKDLINYSTLIVNATCVRCSDPFKIQAYDGGISVFQDYYFEIQNTLMGESKTGKIVKVRLEGGELDGLKVVERNNPKFEIGNTVILFLYQPNMGGGFNVEDSSCYYPVGLRQGVYNETDQRAENSSLICLQSEKLYYSGSDRFTLDEIADQAKQAQKEYVNQIAKERNSFTSKVDLKKYKDDQILRLYEENIKQYKDAGVINDYGYSELNKSITHYARIVK